MKQGGSWILTIDTTPQERKISVLAELKEGEIASCSLFTIASTSAENYSDCHTDKLTLTVDQKYINIEDRRSEVTFESLEEGLYCIYVDRCVTNENVEPCHGYANLTAPYPVIPATYIPPTEVIGGTNEVPKIACSILGVISALILVALLAVFHFRRRQKLSGARAILDNLAEEEKETDPAFQNVFLIYSHDFDLHVDAVKTFADVLEKCFKCTVSFDEKELHEIMTNVHSWIHSVNYRQKIIIVSSEGAYLKQQAWLKNKEVHVNPAQETDYFIRILDQLSFQQRNNYADIVNIRFSYTNRHFIVSDVVSLRHYDIPDDLEAMVKTLHNGWLPNYDKEDSLVREFQDAVNRCKIFVENNPEFIQKSLTPEDTRTNESDIQSNPRNPFFMQSSIDSGNGTDESSLDSPSVEDSNSLQSLLKGVLAK